MKTLYQRLKPEIKLKLKENMQKYKHGPREVIAELHRFTMYGDLTMNTIRQLMIWGDVDEFEWDRIDFKYGDKLFTDGEIRDKVYGTID
tara:strand:- start:185 stop:451 length:267 start_codon:yes stop_codon:yes gene_type:complete